MAENRIAGDHAPRDMTTQPASGPADTSRAARDGAATTDGRSLSTGASGKSRGRRKAARQPGARARRGARGMTGGSTDKVMAPPGTPEQVVRIGSPASLLALVPQLMGFEPRDSIVVIGVRPPRGQVQLTLRFDLEGASDSRIAREVAWHLLSILAAQGLSVGVAVGYGPGRLVTPVADALRKAAGRIGIQLTELLRAHEGRYWSYLCTEPACCPADGVPYDIASHPVTAAFAAAGAPPVLPGRAELAATVGALDGAAGESMQEATRLAEERADRLIAELIATGRKGAGRRLIATAGLTAVREAISLYRVGGTFASDADAAWLSVVLGDLRVRDDAWSRMDPEHRGEHLRLWTDLTRRARPGHVAPAAALLAFVAWQCGNGALANVALDRALADNQRYSMALLLREIIDAGAPPEDALCPLTPEQVTASYAHAYGDPQVDDPGGEAGEDTGYDAGALEFGDAEFGDPGYDDCEVDDVGEEEITRQE